MTAQAATAMQTTKATAPVKQAPAADLFELISDSIMRRAYELFDGSGRWFGNDWGDWFRAEAELLHPLYLEVTESDDGFTVEAEVPGFSAKDLEIKVESQRLSIAGKRESKEENRKGKTIRSERCSDQILRTLDLPAPVDTGKAKATVKDGVLTIELPKAPHAKAVRIACTSTPQ
jgi:HSP20 family molecular chaperone IbpA